MDQHTTTHDSTAMNQETSHPDPRSQAETDFQHSLQQLEETLKTGKAPQSFRRSSNPLNYEQEPEAIDEAALDEAAADIDEFMKRASTDAEPT